MSNGFHAGVLMGAVLLGVLINKASIPSARVVFSDVCLLTSRNGEPVLILRIGNTRGNFLLNPEIRVGFLKVRQRLNTYAVRSQPCSPTCSNRSRGSQARSSFPACAHGSHGTLDRAHPCMRQPMRGSPTSRHQTRTHTAD
jgi:hypothetical protein